eukprot:EG_transcript_21851
MGSCLPLGVALVEVRGFRKRLKDSSLVGGGGMLECDRTILPLHHKNQLGGTPAVAVYYFALAFGGIVFLIMLLVFIALRHLTHLELVEQQRKRVMAEQQPKFAGGDASPSSKVFSKLSGKFADEEEEDSCMMSSSIISPFCPEDV